MSDKPEPELPSWLRPVYEEPAPTPEGLKKYQMCKHCKEIRMHHVGEEEKCLFDSSTFAVLKSPLR
jgi:hypothetical protein